MAGPTKTVSVRVVNGEGDREWRYRESDEVEEMEDDQVDASSVLPPWIIADELWEQCGRDDRRYLLALMDLLRVSQMDVTRRSGENPSSLSLQLKGCRPLRVDVGEAVAEAIAERIQVAIELYRRTEVSVTDEVMMDSVLGILAERFDKQVTAGRLTKR